MLVEAVTRHYEGKSVLTAWDIAAEVFGDMDADNYLRVKGAFIDNINKFIEGEDYINVPRDVIIGLGLFVERKFSATKFFQLFTKSGAHKLLEAMDLEDTAEVLDDKFDDEEIVIETQKVQNADGAIVHEIVEAVVQPVEKEEQIREEAQGEVTNVIGEQPTKEEAWWDQPGAEEIFEAPVKREEKKMELIESNHSLLSEKVLSLINYIATSKSLFMTKKVANIEVGSVVFNTTLGFVQIITDIVGIPPVTSDSVIKYMVQGILLKYNKTVHQWELSGNTEFITTESIGVGTNRIIADRGVEFLLGLKTVEKSIPFVDALEGIQELLEEQRKIKERLDNKLEVIYSMNF